MLTTPCNKAGHCKQLVVAGQKSGWLWALSPDSGQVHWSVNVGPGGIVGGLQWGSAADGSRIYVANNNYHNATINLKSMKPVVNFRTNTNQAPPTSTNGGLAAAIDAYSGEIVWTFANPTLHWGKASSGVRYARSQAPVTVANDVVYYASMDLAGTLFMLDARTGKLLNSFETGITCGCGPSVVDGKVSDSHTRGCVATGCTTKGLHGKGCFRCSGSATSSSCAGPPPLLWLWVCSPKHEGPLPFTTPLFSKL